MRVLAIVHERDAGPGVFADEIHERGAELDTWLIRDSSEPPSDPLGYEAVMTFGGAMNVSDRAEHPWIDRELELLAALHRRGTPLLGACLGAQLLAEAAGGSVRRAREPEIGWYEVKWLRGAEGDPVLPYPPGRFATAPGFLAFQWHSYEADPPPGSVALAASEVCNQAYRLGDRAWGIQFHAEVAAADAQTWIRNWRTDPDAIAIGLDPEAFGAETGSNIAGWNRFGRELCGRFLAAAAG